jgi:hypothetical protein
MLYGVLIREKYLLQAAVSLKNSVDYFGILKKIR